MTLEEEKSKFVIIKGRLRDYWIYLVLYLFFLFVSYTSARGGDDWELSSWYQKGMLSTFIGMVRATTYLNGRIIQNLFTTFFAYYDSLWCLVSPAIFTGIIYFANKLFGLERKIVPIITSLLVLLSVSNGIRVETFTNLVGNIAYLPEILLWLLYLYLITNEYSEKQFNIWKNKWINYFSIALLALVIGLWVENVTIGFLLVNTMLLVIYFIRNKKISMFVLFGLSGSIVGCIIMFLAPAHQMRLSQYGDPSIGIIQRININIPQILQILVLDNIRVYFVCFIILFILLATKKIQTRRKIINFLLILFSTLVSIILFVKFSLDLLNNNYYFTYDDLGSVILREIDYYFFNISKPYSLIFCTALLLFILIPILLSKEKLKLFVLYCFGLLAAGVMAAAPYIGSRIFTFPVFMMIPLVAYFVSLIEIKSVDGRKAIILILVLSVGLQMEQYYFIGKYVKEIETIRLSLIEDYRTSIAGEDIPNDKWLVLPAYRKGTVISTANPEITAFHMAPLKRYYDLPDNAKVIIDDGFAIKEFNVVQDKTTNLNYTFEVIPLNSVSEYSYVFSVLKNGNVVYKSEVGNDNDENYQFQEPGTYSITCTLTNKNLEQKNIYASEFITIK